MKTDTVVEIGQRVVSVQPIPFQHCHKEEWGEIPVGEYGTIMEVFDEWLYFHCSVVWDNHPEDPWYTEGRLTQNPTLIPMWVRPDQIEMA